MSYHASDMPDALILAGGLGTRLRPDIADRPKVLAPVDGHPFLGYLLEQLRAADVHRTILCTGYLGDQVEACFGDVYRGMHLVYSREPAQRGTGGALRLGVEKLQTPEALVLNGDSYCAVDLTALVAAHRREAVDATLTVVQVDRADRYGSVALGQDRRIQGFVEKNETAGPGWINAGIYVTTTSFLLRIPRDRAVSLEKEIFPAHIGDLRAFPCQGPFIDIGTPESYRRAAAVLPNIEDSPRT